jgi:hypothetical protein
MPFVREMWSAFIAGKHHRDMAEAFERVAEGKSKETDHQHASSTHQVGVRVLSVSPRGSLGKFPEKKIIETAHTAELSRGLWS